MNKCLKALLITSAVLSSTAAYAIPNIWNSGYGQGITENIIENEQGDTFTISCDEGYSDNGELTGASFYLANGDDLSPSEEYSVELLIKGSAYWIPDSLGWRNGDNAWFDFLEVIKTATQFDVYVNKKKAASFSPSIQSANKVLDNLSSCVYRG